MSKNIKVSDETHERLMSIKSGGETVDDVIARHLQVEPSTELQQVLNAVENMKVDLQKTISSQKIASEATPQSTRKVAGGRGAKDTFTPNDEAEPLEKPCCSGSKPCQHWQWDGNSMNYVNSLSSRWKAPEA